MIPQNVLTKVFKIGYKDKMGTAFALDINNHQYLITAKHIFKDISQKDTIRLFHEKIWKNLSVELVGITEGDVDVCVLSPSIQVAPKFKLNASSEGLFIGHDLYFLGFPYGMGAELGETMKDYPLPFVKKGVLSNLTVEEPRTFYIDGHNNKGFSGGPVVFKDLSTQHFKVAGVISGYDYEYEPIFRDEKETTLKYKYNTGIVISYPIKYALDIISENPIGTK